MPARFASLPAAAAWFDAWLVDAALPLWASAGLDAERGGFREALTPTGEPLAGGRRRSRVQARQTWVYATAAAQGLGAAYGAIAERAHRVHVDRYLRPDGLFAYSTDAAGRVLDPTAALYEQAFALLAMSALEALGGGHADEAEALVGAMSPARHPTGGWREAGDRPFQANAQMHLLEAMLAWEAAARPGARALWAGLADEIAELALDRFVEAERGVLREFFDADWRALADDAGGLVEPGHQFEWAWLLDRWGRLRGREDARAAARRLYRAGRAGVDPELGVVLNALWSDLSVRDPATRLWAQTEYLRSALLFGDDVEALRAAEGLALYLDTPRRGAWRDKLRPDRAFVEEPAPASSLYHLAGAILPLRERA